MCESDPLQILEGTTFKLPATRSRMKPKRRETGVESGLMKVATWKVSWGRQLQLLLTIILMEEISTYWGMRKSKIWAYNMIWLELYADLKQLVLQPIKHTCTSTLTIKEKVLVVVQSYKRLNHNPLQSPHWQFALRGIQEWKRTRKKQTGWSTLSFGYIGAPKKLRSISEEKFKGP